MGKTLLLTALAFSCFASCDLDPKNHTAQIQEMEDTLFKSFPTVNRVSVEVRNDFGKEINITLGDAELYTASENERQKVVDQTTQITGHIFAEDKIETGKVIFVKEENTITIDEATMKQYEMTLPKK
ncbi:MAG TPA: hypothetical protein PL009_13755 [Flavipsychrobacter sp.]|nr:hypothetical protein [Flavipsychrobacter sp.]